MSQVRKRSHHVLFLGCVGYNNNNNNKLKFIPRSFYKNIQLRLTINIKLIKIKV